MAASGIPSSSNYIISNSTRSDNDYVRYQFGEHPKYDAAISYFKRLILEELSSFNIKVWVGGGAVRDYFLYSQITSDVDLYFSNDEQYEAAKAWI